MPNKNKLSGPLKATIICFLQKHFLDQFFSSYLLVFPYWAEFIGYWNGILFVLDASV